MGKNSKNILTYFAEQKILFTFAFPQLREQSLERW